MAGRVKTNVKAYSKRATAAGAKKTAKAPKAPKQRRGVYEEPIGKGKPPPF